MVVVPRLDQVQVRFEDGQDDALHWPVASEHVDRRRGTAGPHGPE